MSSIFCIICHLIRKVIFHSYDPHHVRLVRRKNSSSCHLSYHFHVICNVIFHVFNPHDVRLVCRRNSSSCHLSCHFHVICYVIFHVFNPYDVRLVCRRNSFSRFSTSIFTFTICRSKIETPRMIKVRMRMRTT